MSPTAETVTDEHPQDTTQIYISLQLPSTWDYGTGAIAASSLSTESDHSQFHLLPNWHIYIYKAGPYRVHFCCDFG